MLEQFNISQDQKETLIHAVSWITILIAGADGSIENEELEWAKKITQIRAYKYPKVLENFYVEVGKTFQANIDALISELPGDVSKRTSILSEKLATLNPILAILDNESAYSLYNSYTSFAEHIAKSDGGFLGFFSVSPEEKKLIGLPMLDQIVPAEDSE